MTNSSGNYLLRLSVVVVSHLITFAGVWLAVWAIARLPALAGALMMVPVAVAAGILRGFVFANLLYLSGLDPVPLLSYRVIGGLPAITLPILISAVIVKKVWDFQATRGQLLAETARLEATLAEARSRLEDDAGRRLATIRETILDSLKRWEGQSASEAAGTIQYTIDDIVRPLSHRLDSEELVWSPTEKALDVARVKWREALTGIFEPRNLHPLAIAVTATGFGVNFLFQHHPPLAALYALTVIFVLDWTCFVGLRRVLSVVSLRRPRFVPLTYLVGAVIIATIIGLAISPLQATTDEPFVLLFYAWIFVFAFAGLFSIAASASEQAREANERLAEATQNVAWETARVSEEIRQARQAMAKDLHGRVQSGFMASLMKLQRAIDTDHADIALLTTTTINELEKIVASVGVPDNDALEPVSDIIRKVTETWNGVATVNVGTTGITLADIERDPVVSRTLADLIPELVFNSIRHGNATKVDVTFRRKNSEALIIRCRDDGEGPTEFSKVGLGTKLLDSCALTWGRNRLEHSTVTEVTLPFSPSPSPEKESP
jgi:signal transduction histidine kinase